MRLILLTLTAACAASPLAAQTDTAAPRRPALPADADTNSARAYYEFGVQRLTRDPKAAAAAFYWSARIDPEAAQYPYARRVALILDDPPTLYASRIGDAPRARHARALDSLMIRALILDPFLHPRLDDRVWAEFIARANGTSIVRGPYAPQIERRIRNALANDPEMNYIRGSFDSALALWARVGAEQPRNPYVRLLRARAFYLRELYDSARVQMMQAIELARTREADTTRAFYESKASWEYGLGKIEHRLGHIAAAREAYESAVTEDLSYYPAHIQLGLLAIERGDTAGALRELARAVESRDDEYLPHATYAFVLAGSGRLDSAVAHLRRTIEIEPWAAQPRLNLGTILDAQGDTSGAVEAFVAYLARAARDDADRVTVTARVRQLRTVAR